MRTRFAFLVTAALVLAPAHAPAGPWRTGAAGYDRAMKEQDASGVPAFVYFRTEWCGYCKKLDAAVLPDPALAGYLSAFERVVVNPETGPKERALADAFGVKGYPSLYVVLPGAGPVKVRAYTEGKDAAEKQLAALRSIAGDPKPPPGRAGKGSLKAGMVRTEILAQIPQEVVDLQDEERHGEAVARLSRAIPKVRGKESAPLFFARAVSLREEGKKTDAVEDLAAALRADPSFYEARLLLARTYMDLTLWDEAVGELDTLIARMPDLADAYWLRAYSLGKKGNKKGSKADYARACTLGMKEACSRK